MEERIADLKQSLAICIAALAMTTGAFLWSVKQKKDLEATAVDRGFADYVVRKSTVEFKWKEPK